MYLMHAALNVWKTKTLYFQLDLPTIVSFFPYVPCAFCEYRANDVSKLFLVAYMLKVFY